MAQQQWLPGGAWVGLLALERTLPSLSQLSHAVEAQVRHHHRFMVHCTH
jgi:hypothetical protein